jgi:hypothetical protein
VVLSLAATRQRLYLGGGGGGGHVASYRMSDGRKYWQPATDGDVTGVAPYHGWLFVTGHFTTVNGVPGHVHLALMNATTSKVNAGWTPGANSLLGTFPAVAYGQQVYTGGDFTKIGATPRQSHAHFAAFSDTVTDSTSPTITRPPSVAMRAGTTIGSAVPVTLSWGGTDDVSGICRFTIRQAIDSGAYGLLTPVLPRFTSLPRALRFNATYRFHVTATDCSDNVSTVSGGTARVGVYQNGSPSITYSGSWKRASVSGASGGGISYTTRRGSGAALNFTGRQVAWVASKSAGRGRANVYVDGQLIKVVDLHAGSLVRRQVVFTRTFPTAGAHRIKVIAQGTPGRPMVDVDAFLVLR